MYDYTPELNEKHGEGYFKQRNFIRYYEIKNSQIVCELANGEKYFLVNTPENIRKVKEKMEDQVGVRNIEVISSSLELKKKSKISKLIKWVTIGIITGSIIYASPGSYIFSIPATLVCGLLAVKNGIEALKVNNKQIEVKKIKILFEHQRKLNQNAQVNDNILARTTSKRDLKLKFKRLEKEQEELFSINNIDEYSLYDLRQLVENIQREQELRFDPKVTNPSEVRVRTLSDQTFYEGSG